MAKSKRGSTECRDPLSEAQAKAAHMKEVWAEETEHLAIMRELHELGYALHYIPNPGRFVVRLKWGGYIDHKPPATTSDILGYGKTRTEAAKNALAERSKRLRSMRNA